MPRRPAIFTQADLYRAAVAAKRAGMEAVASADGTIRFVQKGEKLPEIALLSLGGIHPWCHESVLPFHAAATVNLAGAGWPDFSGQRFIACKARR